MSENTGGSLPNREHYFKAAMIGGGVAALLSVTPVINWLNFFFFCLVMAGGTVAAYWVQRKTGTVEPVEGAAIGALAGVVCGLLLFGLGLCLSSGFSVVAMPDMSRRESREFTTLMMLMLSGSCCFSLTLFPLFAALGGLVAPLIWPPEGKTQPDAPKAEPSPEDVARRKKVTRVVLSTLGGCAGMLGLFCVVTGYLAYLQSRGPEDTAGQDGVAEAQLVMGERVELQIPPSGQSSTQYAIWLVSERDLPLSLYELDGRSGCRSNGRYASERDPYMSNIYAYTPDDGEPQWALLDTVYEFGESGSTCRVQIDSLPAGVTGGRIVITRLREPSDWF